MVLPVVVLALVTFATTWLAWSDELVGNSDQRYLAAITYVGTPIGMALGANFLELGGIRWSMWAASSLLGLLLIATLGRPAILLEEIWAEEWKGNPVFARRAMWTRAVVLVLVLVGVFLDVLP